MTVCTLLIGSPWHEPSNYNALPLSSRLTQLSTLRPRSALSVAPCDYMSASTLFTAQLVRGRVGCTLCMYTRPVPSVVYYAVHLLRVAAVLIVATRQPRAHSLLVCRTPINLVHLSSKLRYRCSGRRRGGKATEGTAAAASPLTACSRPSSMEQVRGTAAAQLALRARGLRGARTLRCGMAYSC